MPVSLRLTVAPATCARGAVVAAAMVMVAAVVILADGLLSLGMWHHTTQLSGPFTAEAVDSPVYNVRLGRDLPLWPLLASHGGTGEQPRQSTLQAWANGQQLGPANAPNDIIRRHGGGAFSHWGNALLFSLPAAMTGADPLTITVEYVPRVAYWCIDLCQALLLVGGAYGFMWLRQSGSPVFERRLARGLQYFGRALRATFALALGLVAAFAAGAVYGYAHGYTLPTTGVFTLFPLASIGASHEPATAYVVLLYAAAGAAAAWIARSMPHLAGFQAQEQALERSWLRWGWLLIAGYFLFSQSATWHGGTYAGDLSSAAIGGLVPFNDAGGHLLGIVQQSLDGHWGSFLERRPFAAAVRTVVMLASGFSPTVFAQLQALALALATYAAARAVTLWRGVWSGITLFGLVAIVVRPYLPTQLTEPWGIFWSLVAVPLLINGLRAGAVGGQVAGFVATCVALMTRMGSMFSAPALALWILWTQRERRDALLRTFAGLALAAGLVGGASSALLKLYGGHTGALAGNFSYVACGLAHGENWTGCLRLYAEDLQHTHTEAEVAQLLYAKTWVQIRARPAVLVKRLVAGERYFLDGLATVILGGYAQSTLPAFFPRTGWFVLALAGVVGVLRHRREQHERTFWAVSAAALLMSAPWVIFDDGWRVLCGGFVLIAVFLALGFTSPWPARPTAAAQIATLSRITTYALGLVLTAMLIAPWAAHRLDPLNKQRWAREPVAVDEVVMLAGRFLSGFLVVPDAAALPPAIPAFHYSTFATVVGNSGVEQYAPLLQPDMRTREFGVVSGFLPQGPFVLRGSPVHAVRLYGAIYIVPPAVMRQTAVQAWKLHVPPGPVNAYWYDVAAADPVVETAPAAAAIVTPRSGKPP